MNQCISGRILESKSWRKFTRISTTTEFQNLKRTTILSSLKTGTVKQRNTSTKVGVFFFDDFKLFQKNYRNSI